MQQDQPTQPEMAPPQPVQPSFQPTAGGTPPQSSPVPPVRRSWWARLRMGTKIRLIGTVIIVIAFLIAGLHNNAAHKAAQNKNPFVSSSAASTGTAKTTSDFAVVCTGGKITNAAAYDVHAAGIHTMKGFQKSEGTGQFIPSVQFLGVGVTPPSNAPEDVQLVLCMSRTGAANLVQTCSLTDSITNKAIDVQVMRTDYELDVYAAKTGKIVGSNVVKTSQEGCPSAASIDPDNPVYYELPNQTALQNALKQFTQ